MFRTCISFTNQQLGNFCKDVFRTKTKYQDRSQKHVGECQNGANNIIGNSKCSRANQMMRKIKIPKGILLLIL